MTDSLSERDIVQVWQHQLLDRAELVTEEGEPIEIIYPGRINDDQGADFRDAVIATSKGLRKGDIEVHVKSRSWRDHQHHQDTAYNRVILHVVMWHNTKMTTTLQNGGEIPTLAMHKYIKTPISQWSDLLSSPTISNLPCLKLAQRLTTGQTAEFLDKAGTERFLDKAARFRRDLAQTEASQCLYQGIMGALGYSRNKLPFLELARRSPLQILESMIQDKIPDDECLARQQAMLLGTAGLLPSQRQDEQRGNGLDDKWIEKLEGLWNSCHYTEAMPLDAWHLFKVRPNNSPVRRLVAMSHLLLYYREKGILEELIDLVKKGPVARGYHRCENGLMVNASGYWASHFGFGPGSKIQNSTLLGSRQAAVITVNVLLPFTFAWSQFTCQPELERKAYDLYGHYPKLAVNSIERHMTAQLGLSTSLVNSARRQQGLIQIYNTLCTQGKCNYCPLSHV